MAISKAAKGKKRAREEEYVSVRASSSSLSPPPEDIIPRRKKARAETRQCPVCEEQIPLRLLSMHATLESERVEAIVQQVGRIDLDVDFDDLDDALGPSSRIRRSAAKAKKSMLQKNPNTTLEQVGKTIQTIKRRRKNRHAKLKEMAREEEEGYVLRNRWMRGIAGGEIVCPVCSATVQGDQDVVDAHVDSCLANESRRIEQERRQRIQEEEVWEEIDDPDGYGGLVADVTGSGFHTRDRQEQDVEEEIDIDGDDQAVYGEPQFTEGDILPVDIQRPEVEEDVEVEMGGDNEDEAQQRQMTLRDLVAEGKNVKRNTRTPSEDGVAAVKAKMDEIMGVGESGEIEVAIMAAKRRNDKNALIAALENKVKHLESIHVSSSTSLLCRICLDPYHEPTVSTGCWHTCCRECWLRCLGSTKLCPICKRITNATELRRVYL
ncbi:hypothetical protein BDQ17DRAFT_1352083 [Cyathus striatus]|nr:hypothetical protein BDQ17DRAFT_1352083 [Cyathus striatus]